MLTLLIILAVSFIENPQIEEKGEPFVIREEEVVVTVKPELLQAKNETVIISPEAPKEEEKEN